ncbi:ATP-dependent DNA ligase Cdc17 [Binucleata daphniae]
MENNSFSNFCIALENISQTKKRLEIQSILTKYMKTIKKCKNTLVAVLYLSTGTFYPEHFGKQLGVGENAIYKLVCEVTGKKLKNIKDEMRIVGDLGSIAMKYKISSFVKKNINVLSVEDVLSVLREISDESGTKSGAEKLNKMIKVIVMSSGIEIKYLIRLFEGKLKIGLATKTVLISLAMAFTSDEKEFDDDTSEDFVVKKQKTNTGNKIADHKNSSDCSVSKIKFAYNQCPIFEDIVECLYSYGIQDIDKHIKIKPGIPVKPMLAQPSKNLTSAFKRVENVSFTCEYKYDGERAQIHRYDGKYKVFSRNSEDLTDKYPDLKDVLHKIEKNGKNFILDAEIVAYCLEEKKILPFQILTTRKRKNVKVEDIKINICLCLTVCITKIRC